MSKSGVMAVAMLAASMMVLAADKPPAFDKVPDQALQMLKGAVGKPQNSGLVFVNGQYLRPPYRVARMGTAIFINDVQVTDQIQPWRKFLSTQPGYTGAIQASAKPAAVVTPAGEAKNLDDLFADDDSTPPPPPKAEPVKEVTPEPEIEFKPNAKSLTLLQEIDAYRTDVQRKLREGNAIFFGSRYARIVVEPRLVKTMLSALPEAMRDAEDGVELESRVRAKGIAFLNRTLCGELITNRPDYLKLAERRKFLKELECLENIEKGKLQERGR